MLKNRALLLLLAAVISTAVIGIYLFLVSGDKKAVMATTDKYIQAVMNRDFDAVYDLNAASRKQVAFILKGHGADKEELLKRAYNEQKALFDSAEEAFNSKAAWAEKSTLFQSMSYRILNVTMERDIDNPSAFFRKRVNAIVEVEVEYRKKEDSPVYKGRSIRKAVCLIKLIHSKNITKAVRYIAIDDKWLFKGITVRDADVVYW